MDDYIYIFLHIPKTAGSTFRYHIKRNFSNNEYIFLTLEKLGFDKNSRGIISNKEYKKAAEEFFKTLSKKQKRDLKIIYGHFVPYGIDKYFSRQARYFTFVRDPVNRVKSFYKHKLRIHNQNKKSDFEIKNLHNTFYINKKVPKFEDWLDKIYYPGQETFLTMAGFLKRLNYLDIKVTSSSIKDMFNKFYFVGITTHYDEDALYLYKKLRIHKFYVNQNVSKRKLYLDESIDKKIIAKCRDDMKIYKAGLRINQEKRNNYKNFDRVVDYMRMKRRIFLPLNQFIFDFKYGLKLSSYELKKKSTIYKKTINGLKNFLGIEELIKT